MNVISWLISVVFKFIMFFIKLVKLFEGNVYYL